MKWWQVNLGGSARRRVTLYVVRALIAGSLFGLLNWDVSKGVFFAVLWGALMALYDERKTRRRVGTGLGD